MLNITSLLFMIRDFDLEFSMFLTFSLHFVFYKQPVYKQLALEWQIAKHLLGFNPLSLKNNKNYKLKKVGVFPL